MSVSFQMVVNAVKKIATGEGMGGSQQSLPLRGNIGPDTGMMRRLHP